MPLEEQAHKVTASFMGWALVRPQGVDMGCSLEQTATKGRALHWISVGVDLQNEDARWHKARPLLTCACCEQHVYVLLYDEPFASFIFNIIVLLCCK